MAADVITLRPAPAGESCREVGDSGYAEIAVLECGRYIALLRLAFGPEPDGVRLRTRRAEAEADPYIDVVAEFDADNAAARDYAIRCERDAPMRWPQAPAHDPLAPWPGAQISPMERNPVKEIQP